MDKPEEQQPEGLAAATGAHWLGSLANMAGGMVRGKISAVVLGTVGVGVIAQLNAFSLLAGGLGAMGLGNAGVRGIAESLALEDEKSVRRTATLVLLFPLLIGSLVAVAILPAAPSISNLLFDTDRYALFVILAALSVPLNLLFGSWQIILQGYRRVGRIARVIAVAAGVNTVVVSALVLLFELPGAAIGILATSVVSLAIMVLREGWVWRLRGALTEVRRSTVTPFIRYGRMSVSIGVASLLVETAVRAAVAHRLGVGANGLYQPVTLLSSQFFLQVNTGIATYLFPSLTNLLATDRSEAANDAINRALRLAILVTAAVAFAVLAGRRVFLLALFSREFLAASQLISLQSIGELLRAAAYVVGALLLPAGLIRSWGAVGALTLGVQLVGSLALLGPLGLRALPLAFTAAWVVNLLLSYRVAKRRLGFGVSRDNFFLAWSGISLLVALVVLDEWDPLATEVGGALAVLLWLCYAVRRDERERFLRFVKSRLHRVREGGHR